MPVHTRIYAALPRVAPAPACAPSSSRVRSNSASSARSLFTVPSSHGPLPFFDSPPAPSRPGSSHLPLTRFVAEVKAELEGHTDVSHPQSHGAPPPYPLALTSAPYDSPSNPSTPFKPFFPYQSFVPAAGPTAKATGDAAVERQAKQQRTRYHLDVGAYGIPKRSHGVCVAGRDGHGKLGRKESFCESIEPLTGAVQVGEDAYFVRDNAMGVADGVGGWSKMRRQGKGVDAEPSASALFARRLMHYCSEEVDAASAINDANLCSMEDLESDDIYAQLEDSLEELEEGLDVLMILERAYEKTIQAHVTRPEVASSEPITDTSLHTTSNGLHTSNGAANTQSKADTPSASWASILSPTPKQAPATTPLLAGSSTALVAILEHTSAPPPPRRKSTLFSPQPRHVDDAVQMADRGAVIKIAHLGDCMGMLIRGEEIVWRTEEMWWNFNTPVQLGPTSPTRPRDAHVFTIPVEADDILILASDGLSDNLWDEDVLDEVVRFRQPYLAQGGMAAQGVFCQSTLAAMLSEALCSRAHCVAEHKARKGAPTLEAEEIPFARRAREEGRSFHGGKPDDISVLVAIVSPVASSGVA